MTAPGFSSRATASTFSQFPQRDGAAVTDYAGMEPGFSNSDPADHAPDDVHPDVTAPPEHAPGFSNGAEVDETPPPDPVEHAIVTEATTTSTDATTVSKPSPSTKKTTARKSSARKKG